MPTIDLTATGANIATLIRNAGLTAADVADTLGFTSRNAIYKWLKGESLPTLDNMVILADMLGVSMDDILKIRRV